MLKFKQLDKTNIEEAKATMCGRCGTKHVPPSKGGTCPAVSEATLPSGSMVPGIPSKRDTAVKRAMRRAAVVPAQKAMATYGVGYRQESVVNEINMSDDEYKSNVGSYGKRATNLLKHSWSQHDVSKEKAKAGDKEGAAKATATGSRAHKLFLKARDKHLSNPEHAEANRKKIMSGASDYYKSKKPGQYTGDSFDPSITNDNPTITEKFWDNEGEMVKSQLTSIVAKAQQIMTKLNDESGLEAWIQSEVTTAENCITCVHDHLMYSKDAVAESSDKLYAGYQADVLSVKAKAAAQEKKYGPVDINKLAARLKAVKLKPEGKK